MPEEIHLSYFAVSLYTRTMGIKILDLVNNVMALLHLMVHSNTTSKFSLRRHVYEEEEKLDRVAPLIGGPS